MNGLEKRRSETKKSDSGKMAQKWGKNIVVYFLLIKMSQKIALSK